MVKLVRVCKLDLGNGVLAGDGKLSKAYQNKAKQSKHVSVIGSFMDYCLGVMMRRSSCERVGFEQHKSRRSRWAELQISRCKSKPPKSVGESGV